MPRYSDEELLDDIRRLASELGRPPSLKEYRSRGEFGVTTLYDRFGSWRDAVEEAGYSSHEPQSEVSDEQLIREIQRLADEELGRRPTIDEMNDQGEYWVSTYKSHFGPWSNALEEAGFHVEIDTSRIPDQELLDELQRLGEELDETPSMTQMENKGKYHPATFRRRFGSWNQALAAAGFEPWSPGETLTQDDLIDELQRLARELGHAPTKREMNEHGKHSPNTYYDRFDSWSAALSIAFEDDE